MVYIRDTHPVLGFRAPTNDRRGIAPELEPRSLADRERWACEDRARMKCTIPVVMDTFDDRTLHAYDAFPQRVCVVDSAGRIAYLSRGLVGFDLANVECAVKASR